MQHKILLYAILILIIGSFNSCALISNHFSFMPDTKRILPINSLPEQTELISIQTEDNITIQALYFKAPESKKVILYFHGNAGNIYDRLPESLKLRDLGYNLVLVSYRGYAESEGKPTEAGVYTDAEAAYRYLTDTLKFKNEDIIIYGRSLGTAVSINVSQNKKIKKLILITPMSSGNDLADSYVCGISIFLGKKIFNSMDKINNITCPILIIHGDKDEFVPCRLGEKLYMKFSGDKEFITIKNGKHNDLEYVDPETYWSAITHFLNE